MPTPTSLTPQQLAAARALSLAYSNIVTRVGMSQAPEDFQVLLERFMFLLNRVTCNHEEPANPRYHRQQDLAVGLLRLSEENIHVYEKLLSPLVAPGRSPDLYTSYGFGLLATLLQSLGDDHDYCLVDVGGHRVLMRESLAGKGTPYTCAKELADYVDSLL